MYEINFPAAQFPTLTKSFDKGGYHTRIYRTCCMYDDIN